MRFLLKITTLSFLLLSIICCKEKNPSTSDKQVYSAVSNRNAQNFKVEISGAYKILSIKNPWKGAEKPIRYLLYPKNQNIPKITDGAIPVPIPLEKVICTGSTQIAIMDFLDLNDKIIAVSEADYIFNPNIKKKLKDKKIQNIGTESSIDMEKVIALKPDAVFSFSYGKSASKQKISELGIPLIYISEFMEDNPLGRAEWMLFMSYFFQKEEEAKKQFHQIANQYDSLKKAAILKKIKPKVLVGLAQEGTWYVPGGKSFISTIIQDAGAEYIWSDNKESGGVPLDFESVYYKGKEADFWINVITAENKTQLLSIDKRYRFFKPFQKDKIFSYTKRISEDGAYDFYESAVIRPDLVLKDLINIFHQDEIDFKELYFYQKLN